jgi:hypothetical protein
MMNKSTSLQATASLGGVCFYGDGDIVKQFVPADMINMLDQVSSQLNVETIKTLGFASTNVDETFTPVPEAE